MKRWAVAACLVVAGIALAEENQPRLSDLTWLAGCWQGGGGEGSAYHEHWMVPDGGAMLGMSRTLSNEKVVAFEFLRIHQENDGIYYTSIPSGQTQASFKLVSYADGKAVFENPDHDFPQRIVYTHKPDGALLASIEGMDKGALKQVDFPMKRATCP
jgi:hypothetical protein